MLSALTAPAGRRFAVGSLFDPVAGIATGALGSVIAPTGSFQPSLRDPIVGEHVEQLYESYTLPVVPSGSLTKHFSSSLCTRICFNKYVISIIKDDAKPENGLVGCG